MTVSEMEFNKLIGQRIHMLLVLHKISIADFADEMDIEYQTMRKYLCGTRKIPLQKLSEMCIHLGCMVEYVFYGDTDYIIGSESDIRFLTDFVIQVDMIEDEEERKNFIKKATSILIGRI